MAEKYWHPDLPAGDHDDPEHLRAHFDPCSRDLTRGRYIRVAARMARECPVVHSTGSENGELTSVSSYRHLQQIHRDDVSFSNFPAVVQTIGHSRPMIPMELDPPRHRPFRQIVAPLLSRAVQTDREPYYRDLARRYVSRFAARGEADLFAELCEPLTINSLMDALGVPEPDRRHLAELGVALVRGNHTDGPNTSAGTASEIYEYFARLADDRRRRPGDDLVSALCHAEVEGRPLTEEEVLDFCILLLPAGFETTASSMSWLFLLLAENPELQDTLRREPELIPSAIEEMLRYVTPTRSHARTVRADVEIGGHALGPGDRVHLNWVGANHDPEVFDRHDEIVIDRYPNRHMSFGFGSHTCLGMHMARAEIKVAIEEVLFRLDDVRLRNPADVVEEVGTTWAVTGLPVVFTQSPERAA